MLAGQPQLEPDRSHGVIVNQPAGRPVTGAYWIVTRSVVGLPPRTTCAVTARSGRGARVEAAASSSERSGRPSTDGDHVAGAQAGLREQRAAGDRVDLDAGGRERRVERRRRARRSRRARRRPRAARAPAPRRARAPARSPRARARATRAGSPSGDRAPRSPRAPARSPRARARSPRARARSPRARARARSARSSPPAPAPAPPGLPADVDRTVSPAGAFTSRIASAYGSTGALPSGLGIRIHRRLLVGRGAVRIRRRRRRLAAHRPRRIPRVVAAFAAAPPPAPIRRRQHDLPVVRRQRHLVLVDRLDRVAGDLLADRDQQVRPARVVRSNSSAWFVSGRIRTTRSGTFARALAGASSGRASAASARRPAPRPRRTRAMSSGGPPGCRRRGASGLSLQAPILHGARAPPAPSR